MRSDAVPHVAMAHEGSFASTSPKVFRPSLNQNECSMATPRRRSSCTAGLHEFWKATLPSWSFDWLRPLPGSSNEAESRIVVMRACVFMDVS